MPAPYYRDQLDRPLTAPEGDANVRYLKGLAEAAATGGAANIYYVNTSGCLGGAQPGLGTTTFGADDTIPFQALLDKVGPKKIVVNISISITKCLYNSDTEIEILPGCEIIQRVDLNNRGQYIGPMLTNRGRSGTQIVTRNVHIHGGGALNGSGWVAGGYGHEKENNTATGLGWAIPFRAAGIENLRVENIRIINPRSFSSFVSNFRNVTFEDVRCDVALDAPYGNFDGCKFQTGRLLRARNVNGAMKDDVISISTNELFWPTLPLPDGQGGQVAFDPSACYGPITDVEIDATAVDSPCGIRLLSTVDRMDRVKVRFGGSVTEAIGIIIDNYSAGGNPVALYRAGGAGSPGGSGNMGSITLEDINMANPGNNSYGEISVGCYVEDLKVVGCNRSNWANNQPWMKLTQHADVRSLTIVNGTALGVDTDYRVMIENAGGKIGVLKLIAPTFNKAFGQARAASTWFKQSSGSTDFIQVIGGTMRNCAPMIDFSGGTIGEVLGSNNVIDDSSINGFIYIKPGLTLPALGLSTHKGVTHDGAVTKTYGDAFWTSNGGGGGGTGGDGGSTPATAQPNTVLGKFTFDTIGSLADASIYKREFSSVNISDNTSFVARDAGYALRLQRSKAQLLQRAYNANFDMLADGYTIALDFRLGDNSGTDNSLLAARYSTDTGTYLLAFTLQNNGASTVGTITMLTQNADNSFTSIVTPQLDFGATWHRVAAKWDKAAGLLRLRLDGVNVTPVAKTTSKASTYPLRIGTDMRNQLYFDGLVDNIVEANYAMSDAELDAL